MAKYIGFGTQLKWSADSVAYSPVGYIESIDGPDASRAEVDVTTLDSTAKEYLAAIRDGGSITVNLVCDNQADDDQAIGSFWKPSVVGTVSSTVSGNPAYWRIEHSGDSSIAILFTAYCTNFTYGFALEDKLSLAANLKVTGAVTWPT